MQGCHLIARSGGWQMPFSHLKWPVSLVSHSRHCLDTGSSSLIHVTYLSIRKAAQIFH